jgi:5-methylcytosine-specific restriction endonuclease McrA
MHEVEGHDRGYGGTWPALRRQVIDRDGGRCRWCGGPATEADHLRSLALGGTNHPDNLVASCKPCNAKRGAILGNRLRGARRRNVSAAGRRALGLS